MESAKFIFKHNNQILQDFHNYYIILQNLAMVINTILDNDHEYDTRQKPLE